MGVCALQVAGLLYYVSFFDAQSYLPSPFINDKTDTFMDFFHPMFWAENDGRYTEWVSVYPPLNFIFLKGLRWALIGNKDFTNAFVLREEGFSAQIFLMVAYLLIPVFVVTRSYWAKFSKKEKLLICISVLASTPMLFALERGNLVIFTLFLLPLLFGRLPVVKLVSIALLVNLKPYFAILFFFYVVKGLWQELILAVGLTGGIFLITGVLQDSNFFEFLANLLSFSQHETLFSLREVMSMPSSVSAFSYVLSSDTFQQSSYSNLVGMSIMPSVIEALKWAIQAGAITGLFITRGSLSSDRVLAVLLVVIANLGLSVGGYTFVFYFTLIPIFAEMKLKRVYLLIVILISLPLDGVTLVQEAIGPQLVYLSGTIVDVQWTLGLGSLMRPVLNLLLLAALAWELLIPWLIRAVANNLRSQDVAQINKARRA